MYPLGNIVNQTEITQDILPAEVSIHRASPVCFYIGWLYTGLDGISLSLSPQKT